MTSSSSRSVVLDHDTLLVLSDLLHRWEVDDVVSEPQDRAERVALWNLAASLEPVVDEAFSDSYAAEVSAAKHRLSSPA